MRKEDEQRLLEMFLKAYFTPGAQYLPDELDDSMATNYNNEYIERVRSLEIFNSLDKKLTIEQIEDVGRCAVSLIDDFIMALVNSGLIKLNLED